MTKGDMRMTARSALPQRYGLTLYEVLLALLIMLVSMAILGSHLTLGTRAAVTSNLRSEAALLCESKLDEVLAGVEPMQSGGGPLVSSLEGEWSWSLVVVPGQPHVDTLALELSVERAASDGFAPVAYSLRRIVRDPALYDSELASDAVSTGGTP